MSHDSLRRKYLKKAQHLIHKPRRPLKLQASVEPFMYHEPGTRTGLDPRRALQYERSVLDPMQNSPTLSDSTHNAVPFTAANQTAGDTDSDTCSLHEQVLGSSSPKTTKPRVPSSDDIPSTPSRSSRERALSPNDLTEYSFRFPSHDIFPPISRHSHTVNSYPLSSTPAARNTQTATNRLEKISSENSETQVENLEEKLKVQTDINRELKRLLVAAVGSDLQLRLNQMLSEKAVLSHRLDTSLKQLADGGEEMDRVAIECDIWRSKYLASRLMIDELASWKAELSLQYKESQRALLGLLQEQKELSRSLAECISVLTESVEGFRVANHTSNKGHTVSRTVLELARDAVSLSQALREHCPSATRPTAVPATAKLSLSEPTPGEQLAKKVLQVRSGQQRSRQQSLPLPRSPSARQLSSGSLSTLSPLPRTVDTNAADADGIPFHCSKCHGRIINV